MMWRWICTYFYIAISALLKVVVGLFLLRICSQQRWHSITFWALISIVTTYNLFFLFLAIFACRPVDYQWTGYNPVPTSGKCNGALLATIPSYISVVITVLADWILPLLPASLVWKARMEMRKKISVYAVLALGSMYVYTLVDSPSLPITRSCQVTDDS